MGHTYPRTHTQTPTHIHTHTDTHAHGHARTHTRAHAHTTAQTKKEALLALKAVYVQALDQRADVTAEAKAKRREFAAAFGLTIALERYDVTAAEDLKRLNVQPSISGYP